MPETFYNTIVILFFTVIPLTFLLLHTLLSSRQRWGWGLVIPTLWTTLGIWMLVTGYKREGILSKDLLIFFVGGDALLLGLTVVIRRIKKRNKK